MPIWLSCAGFVLLLTPTGRLPSTRWRWWARLAAAAPVVTVLGSAVQPDPLAPDYYGNPLAVPALARVLVVPAVAGVAVVMVSLLVGALSLVVRFRRARGMERLQLRWLTYAAALAAGLLLVALFAGFLLAKDEVVFVSLALGVALLPLATGASVLRYRLYDLDRIISRTVAYGLVTVLLGLGYAAVVLGLGRLLPQGSSLTVAAATLTVAAIFQPVRRRVQALADRRSTAAATTPPGPSPTSVPACAMKSTSTPSWLSCKRWSRRRCSRPGRRSGCGRKPWR